MRKRQGWQTFRAQQAAANPSPIPDPDPDPSPNPLSLTLALVTLPDPIPLTRSGATSAYVLRCAPHSTIPI
jgi:hypothetical protein